MNKRFDPRKLTLTDFNPSAFKTATAKLNTGVLPIKATVTPSTTDPVPEGRTTLRLNKLRGVVSSHQDHQPARTEQPVTPAPAAAPSVPESSPPTHIPEAPITPIAEAPVQAIQPPAETPQPTTMAEPSDQGSTDTTDPSPILYLDGGAPPSATIDERTAALHAKAIRPKRPKPENIDPDDLVPLNTRQPKWLKDSFFKACADHGATASIVLRNLMKSYCGLCLLLAVLPLLAAKPADTTYTTDKILSYFYGKAFGLPSAIPDLKSSVALRHSLWQTGAQDSTDYVYADRSNTRLEAKLELPILDVKYLKDRGKEKEHYIIPTIFHCIPGQPCMIVSNGKWDYTCTTFPDTFWGTIDYDLLPSDTLSCHCDTCWVIHDTTKYPMQRYLANQANAICSDSAKAYTQMGLCYQLTAGETTVRIHNTCFDTTFTAVTSFCLPKLPLDTAAGVWISSIDTFFCPATVINGHDDYLTRAIIQATH